MQCWPRKIQTIDYFFVHGCLWTVDQHCKGNFHVQSWFRQIKTTLYSLFSCENMSVRLWPTLQKVFTIFGPWLTDVFLEENNLCNVVLIMLGQHSIRILSRQCCLNTSNTALHKKTTYEDEWFSLIVLKSYSMLISAANIWATLYRIVTYSMSVYFIYMFFIFQGQKKTPEVFGFYYIHQPTNPLTQ